MEGLTWKCHVCGDERPDNKISVYSTTFMKGRVEIGHNVRYCNDRHACVVGAVTIEEKMPR